jgi:Leucine rich repeat N-terminal domain
MRPHYLGLLYLLVSISTLLYFNSQEESEAQILLQIKATSGNPPALASWSSISSSHYTWNEISCTNSVVVEINLTSQNLSQPIPDSICLLKTPLTLPAELSIKKQRNPRRLPSAPLQLLFIAIFGYIPHTQFLCWHPFEFQLI